MSHQKTLQQRKPAGLLIFVKWIGDERCEKFDIVIRTVREDNCLPDIILHSLKKLTVVNCLLLSHLQPKQSNNQVRNVHRLVSFHSWCQHCRYNMAVLLYLNDLGKESPRKDTLPG